MESMKKLWFSLDDKIRYLVVGSFNAGVCYLIYALICLIMGDRFYQGALALAWFLSSAISFTMQRTFVFESRGVWYKEYLKEHGIVEFRNSIDVLQCPKNNGIDSNKAVLGYIRYKGDNCRTFIYSGAYLEAHRELKQEQLCFI